MFSPIPTVGGWALPPELRKIWAQPTYGSGEGGFLSALCATGNGQPGCLRAVSYQEDHCVQRAFEYPTASIPRRIWIPKSYTSHHRRHCCQRRHLRPSSARRRLGPCGQQGSPLLPGQAHHGIEGWWSTRGWLGKYATQLVLHRSLIPCALAAYVQGRMKWTAKETTRHTASHISGVNGLDRETGILVVTVHTHAIPVTLVFTIDIDVGEGSVSRCKGSKEGSQQGKTQHFEWRICWSSKYAKVEY